MKNQIISKSPQQTKKIAQNLAKNLKGGEILGLVGDLGGGKTTFVQGLAQSLGIEERITSPTFIMLREYPIPHQPINQLSHQLHLIHIDLYRFKNSAEIQTLGLQDYLGRKENICVIEWAEKIKDLLPKNTQWIEFDFVDQNTRQIKFML